MEDLHPEKPPNDPPGKKKGPDPSENIKSPGSSLSPVNNQSSANSPPPYIHNSTGPSKPPDT
jgi:hypothetical protein